MTDELKLQSMELLVTDIQKDQHSFMAAVTQISLATTKRSVHRWIPMRESPEDTTPAAATATATATTASNQIQTDQDGVHPWPGEAGGNHRPAGNDLDKKPFTI
ncbi:hypothetical protein BHM03_00001680 [Ensete ventricosum]|nr:hypothetical protein BHM03_00001680 [Ensete ventricosum]